MIIRELRISKNLKQKEVADLIGTSIANYSKKEAGTVKFSIEEANIIANYFNLTMEELFVDNLKTKKELENDD